jgi:hypothetical protein
MITYRLRSLFNFVAMISLVTFIAKRARDWSHQLSSEYVTAAVISEVKQFVESHNGQWPQSWDDIPGGDHARQYVRIRFDVRAEDLIADSNLIYTAIMPTSGVYYTYPHAERQLDQLFESLARFHNDTAK